MHKICIKTTEHAKMKLLVDTYIWCSSEFKDK